jgi:hypothetical protein
VCACAGIVHLDRSVFGIGHDDQMRPVLEAELDLFARHAARVVGRPDFDRDVGCEGRLFARLAG